MKKVKSRFFKYFANKYMIIFANYLNNQLIYPFDEKVFFYRLNNYFIKDATIKRHKEWKFVDKSILELFHDHSDMKLKEIADIFIHDKEKFKLITEKLDNTTRFVVLEPFKDVFSNFLNDHELFKNFVNKVRLDLEKKNKDEEIRPHYYDIFQGNAKNFLDYYS